MPHSFDEEWVCVIKLLSQVFDMCLDFSAWSVAASLVDFVQNHPEFCTTLHDFDNFTLGEKSKFVEQWWRIWWTFKSISWEDTFEKQTNESSAISFLKAQFSKYIWAVLNTCSSSQKSSKQNHLESSPVRKLESLNQCAELRNVKVYLGYILHCLKFFAFHTYSCLFQTNEWEDSWKKFNWNFIWISLTNYMLSLNFMKGIWSDEWISSWKEHFQHFKE